MLSLLQCVQLRKADTDANTWLNGDCSCAFQSSPHSPTTHDEPQHNPSSGSSTIDSLVSEETKHQNLAQSGERSPGKDDESQWRWRALQGGASVVRNIRKGWAHACNATLDVAAAAAELLDKNGGPLNGSGGPEASSSRPRECEMCPSDTVPARSDSPPSPLLMPRPGRGDSFASVGSDWDDCVVLVEHEHEPWQARQPVSLAEWNGWFDSEGRLQVSTIPCVDLFGNSPLLVSTETHSNEQAQGMDCLRRAAYYGGLSPQVWIRIRSIGSQYG